MRPHIYDRDSTLPQMKTFDKPVPRLNHYEWHIRWKLVSTMAILHIGALYGLYLILSFQVQFLTFMYAWFLWLASGLGITAGAHRLWAHKAYRAKAPLRLLLAAMLSVAYQHTIYRWVRNHRMHHKYVDTDADPHNAKRGFFFSHIGWLLLEPLEEVEEKYKTIDMSDLENDWVIMYQKKYFAVLITLFCFVFPTLIPYYLWGEDLGNAFLVCAIFRYIFTLHSTFTINSFAHMWGTKPYDKDSLAVDNVIWSSTSWGEGWHNFHHAFPWDYRTSEFSEHKANLALKFINFFAWLGWAYDMKTVSPGLVARRAARTGDGSHSPPNSQSEKGDS